MLRLSDHVASLIKQIVKNNSANHQHDLTGFAVPTHSSTTQLDFELFDGAVSGTRANRESSSPKNGILHTVPMGLENQQHPTSGQRAKRRLLSSTDPGTNHF
jgi:hypothetical protein